VSLAKAGQTELGADRQVWEGWIVGVLAGEFTPEQRAVRVEATPLLVRLARFGEQSPG
jgi:hypothetical protein